MKISAVVTPMLCFTLLFAGVGCDKTTEEGGPGATGEATGTTMDGNAADTAETFTLSLPRMATEVAPGGAEQVTIEVNRGDEFTQNVTLSFDVPEGITISPEDPEVSGTTEEVAITVEAAADARPGEHSIVVTGTPTEGADSTGTLLVTVTEPDTNQ